MPVPSRSPAGVDPEALLAIRDLELRARVVMEGLQAGLHRSPFHGFSSEFTEYRQYSPGDDLRYLDWKALARSDREYIKKFEDETNLRCLILLDSSRSMSFASGTHPKVEYARTLAATLAYFLLQQRDVVGLARFNSAICDYLEPRWRPGHFRRLLALLERQADGQATDMDNALKQTALLCRKRCLIFIVSDFLSDPTSWEVSLKRLCAAGHDVRAAQILDPAETSLEFGKAAHWQDIESEATLYIDPVQARSSYRDRFQEQQARLGQLFDSVAVRHQTILTDQPLDRALLKLINRRSSVNGGSPVA